MVSTLLALYQKFLFLLPRTLVKKKKEMLLRILQWNIIGVRNPIVYSADYSDDTRLARLQHRTSEYRLSIPRVRLIALNQISSADVLRVGQICMCRRVYAHSRSGRKGFYRYEFNFHTNSSWSFFLSLSLSQQYSTNRVLRANADMVCRVLREEQGWRALQHSAIPRLVIRNPIKPGDTGEI